MATCILNNVSKTFMMSNCSPMLFYRLQVLDEGKFGRNYFIGETTLSLKSILQTNNKKMQKVLEAKPEVNNITCSRAVHDILLSDNTDKYFNYD